MTRHNTASSWGPWNYPYSRHQVCVDAVISALDQRAPIDCVIRNVSEGRGLLSLVKPTRLPKLIYLSCEVRWRNSEQLLDVCFTPNSSLEARRTLLEACTFSEE